MSYNAKTWGTYIWDENKTLSENVSAAQSANALIQTSDLQRIEDGIADSVQSVTVQDIWTGTQSEYDIIDPKDASTLYIITE